MPGTAAATASGTTATITAIGSLSADGTLNIDDIDVDKIKDLDHLPPKIKDIVKAELSKIAKGYQADYTKKTQTLSEAKKEHDEKIAHAEKWNTWVNDNQPLIDEYNTWKKAKDSGGESSAGSLDGDLDYDANDKDSIKRETNKVREDLNGLFTSGFNTILGLMDIQRDNPELKIDPKKVIAVAQKEGITDIKKAFEMTYSEKILEDKIKAAVAREKAVWEEKAKTNVLSTKMSSGRKQLKVIPRERR